jgi:hypothetical protein
MTAQGRVLNAKITGRLGVSLHNRNGHRGVFLLFIETNAVDPSNQRPCFGGRDEGQKATKSE